MMLHIMHCSTLLDITIMPQCYGIPFLYGIIACGYIIMSSITTTSPIQSTIQTFIIQCHCSGNISQKQGWLPPYLYPLVAFTIPGAFYGQALMYMFLGPFLGIVFVSPLKVPRNCYSLLDCLIFPIRLLLFLRWVYGARSRIRLHVACSIMRT